jgi:hypothetical protein
MKHHLAGIILGAGVLLARVTSNAGVYSQPSSISFSLKADEVSIWRWSYSSNNVQLMARSWSVSTNRLLGTPQWDGISDDVPLSVSKACAVARDRVSKQYPMIGDWKVSQLWLMSAQINSLPENSSSWYYLIDFAPKDTKQAMEFKNAMINCSEEVILMDGTVVESQVSTGG